MQREPSWRTAGLLTTASVIASLGAGLWTLFDTDLLVGPDAMDGSARGTALVLTLVAVPTVVVSMAMALRGSAAAIVTWSAGLLYVLYNSLLFLFLTPFNAAFLLYVAMLGTTAWAVWALISALDLRTFGERFPPTVPVRGIAAYVWVVAALNALLWLATVVPALRGPFPPRFLDGAGVGTNVIYVQDLAIWLPLAAVAAMWLVRRQGRGLFVVGSILGMWVIESVSIGVDQWFGSRADPSSAIVSSALVAPFLVFAVVGLVPLGLLLKGIDAEPGPPRPGARAGHPAQQTSPSIDSSRSARHGSARFAARHARPTRSQPARVRSLPKHRTSSDSA